LRIFAVRFSNWMHVVTLTADLNLGSTTDLDAHRFLRQDLLDEGKGARLRVNPKVELAMVR
jgi:hypothetical protein